MSYCGFTAKRIGCFATGSNLADLEADRHRHELAALPVVGHCRSPKLSDQPLPELVRGDRLDLGDRHVVAEEVLG